jgi:hypothetical protein
MESSSPEPSKTMGDYEIGELVILKQILWHWVNSGTAMWLDKNEIILILDKTSTEVTVLSSIGLFNIDAGIETL